MAELTQQTDLEDWLSLIEREPTLAWRMILIRIMHEQRGFSVTKDLAPAVGVSRQYLYDAIVPAKVLFDGEPLQKGHYPVDQMHVKLDAFERALTICTDRVGGVYAITGATGEHIAGFQGVLASSRNSGDIDNG